MDAPESLRSEVAIRSILIVVVAPGSLLSPAQQMNSSESLPLLAVASNSQRTEWVHAAVAIAAQRRAGRPDEDRGAKFPLWDRGARRVFRRTAVFVSIQSSDPDDGMASE